MWTDDRFAGGDAETGKVYLQSVQTEQPIAPRTPVEVRCRFDDSWADGFEIIAVDADESAPYVLRRVSDGAQLPAHFSPTDVRPAR